MTAWIIDERFQTETNTSVLRFLGQENPSAHSDVADELMRAGAGVPGVRSYCPDSARYAFVVLHRKDLTIVGLAFGMAELAFRLPEDRISEAVRAGGAIASEIGPGWIRFDPWTNRETLAQTRERLAFWCSIAAGRAGA